MYPLAFGVLVLQKGSTIAKSALVPALVTDDAELVTANSRLALINAVGAFVGAAPAFAVYQLFGADWSLRYGAVVFVIATILAIQIPRTRLRAPADERLQKLERDEMHTPSILLGSSAMAVLRASVGFLVFFAGVLAQARSRCLGRGGRGRLHRQLHRRARRARAASLGARGGDPRVVARAPRHLRAARCAGGRRGRLRARRVHPRDRRRGRAARVRQPAAARRSRRRTRAARSPSSRPASSWCG